MRCYNCGEPGHRQADCRKAPSGTRRLLTTDAREVDSDHIEDNSIYDDYTYDEEVLKEYVAGDIGPLLMLRRTFLTPRAPDQTEWLLMARIYTIHRIR